MPVLVDGELVLYGYVGDACWDGFTAREVLEALAELGRDTDVTVRINSGGGIADEGIAIYNALQAHRGKVAVSIDGAAVSSASIIAMAGDTITMRSGALMMIHDPAGWVDGTEADHVRAAAVLDKLGNLMAGIYADVTGGDAAAIRSEMKGELWLTGPEAVERGFATATDATDAIEAAAFNYRAYAHAPERLVALADTKRWAGGPGRQGASAPARSNRQTQETTMTKTTPAPRRTTTLCRGPGRRRSCRPLRMNAAGSRRSSDRTTQRCCRASLHIWPSKRR
ncbi:head maturation protease, ClpP-related [Tropicimonas sp. IMCC34043]|uniref:head maturation protease, ClpP-related n=1 Tax=Tropicimonas sp. IMCC34043 TaxID=2248760 RepID=UPI000E252AF0|nr:head maturation protease, ClpP-related [Tropicimonas sp. IMCC34043]